MRAGLVVVVSVGAVLSASGCKKEKPVDQAGAKTEGKGSASGEQPKKKPGTSTITGFHGGKAKPLADMNATTAWEDPGAKEPKPVTRAIAVLQPTKGSKTHAVVHFEATGKGIKVKAEAEGLPKGKHAYHLHLYGDCSGDDGKTAGTHFNLEGSSKSPPADIKIITGNLGELEAGKDGKATAETVVDKASIQGKYSILGRAVIIHAKGNDATKPPIGAAGSRLACGVVGIDEAP